jgi:amino acid transporter
MYAMAEDGLMPKLFSELDERGNFSRGILVSGVVCVVLALCVPFSYLDSMIRCVQISSLMVISCMFSCFYCSAGVLLSFNLTNTALIVTRKSDPTNSNKCEKYMFVFNVLCIFFAFAVAALNIDCLFGLGTFTAEELRATYASKSMIIALVCLAGMFAIGFLIVTQMVDAPDPNRQTQYRVPLVPLTPMIGMVINYILIAQQSLSGLILMCLYFVIASIFYVSYGSRDCEWKSNLLATKGGDTNVTSMMIPNGSSHGIQGNGNSEKSSLLEMHRRQDGHIVQGVPTATTDRQGYNAISN